jgi:hypothetical protein
MLGGELLGATAQLQPDAPLPSVNDLLALGAVPGPPARPRSYCKPQEKFQKYQPKTARTRAGMAIAEPIPIKIKTLRSAMDLADATAPGEG